MASTGLEEKHGASLDNEQRIENLNAEKISTSSGELEAQHVELDEAEASRVLRKVDYRLVPMLSLLYLVAFIDRSNSRTFYHRPWGLSTNASQLAMPKSPGWTSISTCAASSTTLP